MSYKEIIKKIQQEITEYEPISPRATEEQIQSLKDIFQDEFSYDLPENYCDILRISDGIQFNGLTIWPTHSYGDFKESLIDANKDFHDVVSENYLYFAQWDEIVFVLDIISQKFKAVDLSGKATWETFNSCEDMIKFALKCALNDEENNLEALT